MALADDTLLLTPQARLLAGRELAETAIRWELVDAGGDRDPGRLPPLVAVARHLGITVAEIQRCSTFARQTIYRALEGDPAPELPLAQRPLVARLLASALLAEGGEVPLGQLGDQLHSTPAALLPSLRLLLDEGYADLSTAGPVERRKLSITAYTEDWLRLAVSDHQLAARAPGYTFWIAVSEREAPKLAAAASAVVGLDEASVIPTTVAPSTMDSPELGITVRAIDGRSALRTLELTWQAIRSKAGLPPRHHALAAFDLPATHPNAPSVVLDLLTDALAPDLAEEGVAELRAERERYPGGSSERALAAAALSEAAGALRRALGRDPSESVRIRDAEDAFHEYQPASGAGLRDIPGVDPIRKPLVRALQLAVDRLGPYRGGELGSFRRPGRSPRVVPEVTPSPKDLATITRLSGEAIATASASGDHDLATLRVETLRRVINNA